MSFLNKYAAHDQLQAAAPRVSTKTPAQAFEENHQRTIEQLRAGRLNTTHTKSAPNGKILVTLRNGVVPLPIGEAIAGKPRTIFYADSVTQAIDYLQEAIEAARAGEFDELFICTAKKKRSSGEA